MVHKNKIKNHGQAIAGKPMRSTNDSLKLRSILGTPAHKRYLFSVCFIDQTIQNLTSNVQTFSIKLRPENPMRKYNIFECMR